MSFGAVPLQGDPSSLWVPLPIKSFGPFSPGSASGCQAGVADKWPAGMCSLYQLPDVTQPNVNEGPAADGEWDGWRGEGSNEGGGGGGGMGAA